MRGPEPGVTPGAMGPKAAYALFSERVKVGMYGGLEFSLAGSVRQAPKAVEYQEYDLVSVLTSVWR